MFGESTFVVTNVVSKKEDLQSVRTNKEKEQEPEFKNQIDQEPQRQEEKKIKKERFRISEMEDSDSEAEKEKTEQGENSHKVFDICIPDAHVEEIDGDKFAVSIMVELFNYGCITDQRKSGGNRKLFTNVLLWLIWEPHSRFTHRFIMWRFTELMQGSLLQSTNASDSSGLCTKP